MNSLEYQEYSRRVLTVGDTSVVGEFTTGLEGYGYKTLETGGEDAAHNVEDFNPRFVLMHSGVPLTADNFPSNQVVILSDSTNQDAPEHAFSNNAVQYLSLPANPRLVAAYLNSLRRIDFDAEKYHKAQKELVFGDLVISINEFQFSRGGEIKNLGVVSHTLLMTMARIPGEYVSSEELQRVMRENSFATDWAAIRMNILGLRRKMDKLYYASHFVSERKHGFKFDPYPERIREEN